MCVKKNFDKIHKHGESYRNFRDSLDQGPIEGEHRTVWGQRGGQVRYETEDKQIYLKDEERGTW